MSSLSEFQFYCVDRFGDKYIHSKTDAQKTTAMVKTTLGNINV